MELLQKIADVVSRAGEIVLSAHDVADCTREKTSAADVVTAYDERVEAFLKEELLRLVEGSSFYGEEETENGNPDLGWVFVVDPIDGTANFVRDMRQSAVSVALAYNGQVEYAVVLDPYRQELFTARRGCGAWLNGKPIHVSPRPLSIGIFGMGTAPYYPELNKLTLELTEALWKRSCDFRRMGAAVPDLCAVACGRLDAFFECMLSPWDYAAGSLLVQEAGGFVTTLRGEKLPYNQKCSVWASNGVNFPQLAQVMDEVMK